MNPKTQTRAKNGCVVGNFKRARGQLIEQTTQRTNQNSKIIHVPSVKRGKTNVSKSRLVLVLLLIS